MSNYIKLNRKDVASKESFDNLKFVVEGVSKDDTKEVLQLVQITEDYIASTDGFQLRVFKNHWLQSKVGLYQVEKNTANEILLLEYEQQINYPNLLAFFIENTENYSILENNKCNGNYRTEKNSNYYVDGFLLYKLATKGICINIEILHSICKYIDFNKIHYKSKEVPIYLENENCYAVLMPIKVD